MTSEELAVYQADPPSSPHADFVVCLECRRKLALIETKHLRKHELIPERYQEKWPGAPMVCEASHDALSAQSKNYWAKLTPEQRTIQAKKRMTPERRRKQSITISKVRAGLTGLTSEELEQWRINAKNAVSTPEHRQAASARATNLWAERNRKLEEAERILEANWRPGDWDQKAQWHVLANKLLSCEYISNPDLKVWAIASGHYTDATFPSWKTIQRIRDWVRRPLGPRGQRHQQTTNGQHLENVSGQFTGQP